MIILGIQFYSLYLLPSLAYRNRRDDYCIIIIIIIIINLSSSLVMMRMGVPLVVIIDTTGGRLDVGVLLLNVTTSANQVCLKVSL